MIKSIWESVHFGRFSSQWHNDLPSDPETSDVLLGKTCLYETHLVREGNDWQLVTERGGYMGRIAFYLMLPVYAALIALIALGRLELVHLLMFEAAFIALFGWLNGLALHHLASEPDFGVEELSLHRVGRA